MERTEYPAMLAALAPSQAVDVLNERVGHVGRLNSEIAEWLAERRRLEEAYATGLRKLARRPIQGVDLGVFSVPWSTLVNATETQADSHASLATKIEVDVERPLRDFTKSSRELQAMTTMQGNLGALAKDVEQAQSKVDKVQGRGERADPSRVAQANQELDQAQTQWESQAPYVFENLQALDEARLNHLRDVLTQLQTHEVDQVERDRSSAEQCLNVLLNIEVADEIKTFQLKAVASKPRVERASRQPAGNLPTSSSSAASPRPNLASTLSQASANDTGSVQEDEKKGPLKGLKRLSTVIGRKKDRGGKLPPQLESMAETPETNKTRSFGGFGRKKKDAVSLDVPSESGAAQRPHSPMRIGSEAFEPTMSREGSGTPAERHPTRVNGVAPEPAGPALPNGGHQRDLADLEVPPTNQPPATNMLPSRQDSEDFSVPQNGLDPITLAQQEAAMMDGAAPQYNVNIRDAPIAEERNVDSDAVLADMASRLQMQAPPPQRRVGTVRGRRDARNSNFIPASDAPITSTEPWIPSSNTASNSPVQSFEPNASTSASPSIGQIGSLPSSSPAAAFIPTASTSSAFSAPPASTSAALSALPAAFDPSASTSSALSTLPAASEAVPPFRPIARNLTADTTGDNQSVRSGRSLASTTSQGHKHPELAENGLNVSIIENVSAQFDKGRLVSSSLTGEIAVAYNAVESTISGASNIRISNFGLLDKVAPNSMFVNPSAAGREGDFVLNHANLSRTQVAFKYQARTDDSGSIAPLMISTAFRIEPTQASVIVSYTLNPAFAHSAASLSFSNVMLALTLDGTKATGCQSKPVGTFSREKGLIFWQLGDITLSRGAAPVKLLARFATESEAKPGIVEARWEIIGEQAATLGSGIAISAQGQPSGTDAGDPFADESSQGSQYKAVHTIKKLASSNYMTK